MRSLQQLISGLLVALASLGIIVGGLSLSLAEGKLFGTTTPTFTSSATPYTPIAGYTLPPPPPSETATLPPPPTNCPIPTGWIPVVVQPGDSMSSLARTYQTSPEALVQANCLMTTSLFPGVILYVPPIPTKTSIPCGAPAGWVKYIIQPGDTLYGLSRSYGISVQELQRANCMGNSTLLVVGRTIYVPPWAPTPPTPTRTGTPTRTPTIPPFTATPTQSTQPTDTETPVFTDTPTSTPTSTETDPPEPSPTPTDTQTP